MPTNVSTVPFDIRSQIPTARSGLDKAGTEQASANATEQQKLSPDELKQIEQLKARDREVKAHEQAHLSAAGGIATGGASFTFVTGPDGNRYAVGGEVNIDTSEIPDDPEATLRKAELIRRAALAPAQPSSQDQKVAGSATSMANKARIELLQQRQQENSGSDDQRQSPSIDVTV